jgi:sigma-E factor negative regulatory protein RseC
MIEEQIEVVEVIGDQLVLQAKTKSACGSCAVNKGCGTSLLAKVVGQKFTQFQVENKVSAVVGDTVVVGIPEDALLKGSLVMYVLPIFAMLFSALICDFFLPALMQFRDLAIAGLSIGGLILGFLLSRWYFQCQSNARHFSPVVLRKIIGHGKLQ